MDKNVIDNIYDSDLNNELEVNTMKDIINIIHKFPNSNIYE